MNARKRNAASLRLCCNDRQIIMETIMEEEKR